MDSDLVLIRSFPGSFYHPVIFGTSSDHISEKFSDFEGIKVPFYTHKIAGFFRIYDQRGYKKSPDDKNSPEMNELERDLIAVQFLASNFEKQKSKNQ